MWELENEDEKSATLNDEEFLPSDDKLKAKKNWITFQWVYAKIQIKPKLKLINKWSFY